ncbi:unnamed protein product, partial [Mesorhabditis belari]|uniref:Uncharacterized protein n=1 Tax=Mesorhabditis belari TaxID=2138241 RepID=A0AAF3F4A8_9BILA
MLLLFLIFGVVTAWPVSNRTACFKYIDCLEQAQFAFKKCAQGTVVALALETRDKLFHTSAATQWSVVSRCQENLELEGLDFDSLQALVNEDSRECFRRMNKRRTPLQTMCEVPAFPIIPTVPQSPKTCLINFREDRKSCEQMLNCCPEHIKCAEKLNTLSIAYQEAKKKSVAIADRMLTCVYQSLGLNPPKSAAKQDFLRKHRGVNFSQNNANQNQNTQSTVRFIRKERPRKNLKPIPLASDTNDLHANARVKSPAYRNAQTSSDSGDYAFGPQKRTSETQIRKENAGIENKYADKLIGNNVEFQKELENSGKYSFGPKSTVAPKEEEKLEEILRKEGETTVDVETEKQDVPEKTPDFEPRKDLGMAEEKSPRSEKDPFETYDDGTKLDEEAGVASVVQTSNGTTLITEGETTTAPTLITTPTESKTAAPEVTVTEVTEAQPQEGNDEKLEKMKSPTSLEATDMQSTTVATANEAGNYKERVDLVKYLLSSADSFESQLYLQLAAENKYEELERIAAEKRKRVTDSTGNTGQ